MSRPDQPPRDPRPDPRVDRGLEALAAPPAEPPPLCDALCAELDQLRPVAPRSPRRQLATLLGLSLAYAAALAAVMGVRADLGEPQPLLLAALWLVAFVGLAWLVVVPPRGQVMPRWRLAGTLAAALAVLFVAAGLLIGGAGPASSDRVVTAGAPCLGVGLMTALVPAVIAGLLVRGSIPVGRRWAAAALGAAAGSLGGLVLELHCANVERLHMGVAHGGVVAASALLAALVASLPTRSPGRRA